MNCARNYENVLNFMKVMPKILLVPFFSGHGVYIFSIININIVINMVFAERKTRGNTLSKHLVLYMHVCVDLPVSALHHRVSPSHSN